MHLGRSRSPWAMPGGSSAACERVLSPACATRLRPRAVKRVLFLSAGYAAVCRTRDALTTVKIDVGSGKVKDHIAETVIPETESSRLAVLEVCRYPSPGGLQSQAWIPLGRAGWVPGGIHPWEMVPVVPPPSSSRSARAMELRQWGRNQRRCFLFPQTSTV